MSPRMLRLAVVVNIVIAATVFYYLFVRMLGLGSSEQDTLGFTVFRYFTLDSNFLMMVAALIAAVAELMVVTGRIDALPRWAAILTFSATVAVTLTMLVTVCFLGPTAQKGFWSMFQGPNLYFHLIVPLASILVLIACERSFALTFREALWGLAPTVLYAVYYAVNVFTHAENGIVNPAYDWYGFVTHGIRFAFVPLLALPAATFVILTLLRLCVRAR